MNLLIFTIFLASFSVRAETFETTIFSYDRQSHHVRFKNGRVANLDTSKFSNISSLIGKRVTAVINNENKILNLKEVKDDYKILQTKPLLEDIRPSFEATILPNYQAAVDMFERLDDKYIRKSECTDRAHIWAYDEFQKNGIKTMKAFIFFTASYINRNNFKWWFHVAPMIQVNENGKTIPRILDYQFLDHPATVKEWVDFQVSSKRDCKVTSKFSEYDVNPQTEDCYMIYESMYYRLPGDLHAQELRSEYRDSFSESEVKFSRKVSFRSISEENERD